MAGRILGMGDVVGLVEEAHQKIDEDEAQASFEKMVMGDFTLEDMFGMIRMVRKLGPMKKILGMMPGMGNLGDLDVDDRQMNRLEALFTSMTPTERIQPQVIDMSRRRRIARGAGQEVNAVSELLKRFKDMKGMMKQLNKMGLGSRMGRAGKKEALAGLSPSGQMLDPGAGKGGGGLLGGLGGLLGGGGGPSQADLEALGMGGMMDPNSPRPMGSSAPRKGARDTAAARKKEKRKRKQKQKNRRKR